LKAIIILLAIALLFLAKIKISVIYDEKFSAVVGIMGIEKQIKHKADKGRKPNLRFALEAIKLVRHYAEIEKLDIEFLSADSDPFDVFKKYELFNIVLSALKIDNSAVNLDYNADKDKIKFKLIISIRLWHTAYITAVLAKQRRGQKRKLSSAT